MRRSPPLQSPPSLWLLPGLLLVAAAVPEPLPSPRQTSPSERPGPVAVSAAPAGTGPPLSAPGWSRNASDSDVRADSRDPPPRTQRALSVLVLASGALIVYFVIRTVRLRRRNRKTRRYGVLDTNIENMELTPLEQDDDEDDTTLFDANHPRR
ncbi:membrane protein FAM174A [Tiliqua scincoides]|uniref:membrane protein FAM174A n=1 Tax=Tiliqua scincoides TaxID=71010 RepID=UPI0034634475